MRSSTLSAPHDCPDSPDEELVLLRARVAALETERDAYLDALVAERRARDFARTDGGGARR